MNISNPRRLSYLRDNRTTWTYGGNSAFPNQPMPTEFRRRAFQPVDYPALKAVWEEEREGTPEKNVNVDIPVETQPATTVEIIMRMFTVFPYRDASWLVSVIFAVGSMAFIVNGALALIPIVSPSLGTAEISQAATVILNVAGTTFLVVGFLALFSAFNVDRGTINPKLEGEQTYKPALLGSKEWVWFPSMAELRTVYLPNLAFRAGLLQLAGGIFYSILLFAAIPGVIDLTNPTNLAIFIAGPQVLGGSMFFLGAIVTLWASDFRWYKPQPFDASWQNIFWNIIGGGGFLVTGLLALLAPNDTLSAAIVVLVASIAFWFGSLFQWYILMGFYPA